MIHHLASLPVGWLIFAAFMLALSLPGLLHWIRFEIELHRRLRRRARVVDHTRTPW